MQEEFPNIITVPTIHKVDTISDTKQFKIGTPIIPFVLINLGYEDEYIEKDMILGYLENTTLEINDITTDDGHEAITKKGIEDEFEKKFITSPADIDTQRRVQLKDAEVDPQIDKQFRELCEEYSDVFSNSSSDIGKTPLITMDIDTGDSPPVCQRPYNLPLKHAEWVERELKLLEEAGIIVRSVSPWASPIVVVPKRSEPGEPPRRRLCVDYRAINKLLPLVTKAHSKAKGVLTLVPLPKIDEIYARLKNSKIYTTLDFRSGYHHMALSAKAKPKSAFVTPIGKYEFTRCPFGLAQAPAYFQQLVNQVLARLPFAFGYLDDILIYSADAPTHLDHLRQVFQRF